MPNAMQVASPDACQNGCAGQCQTLCTQRNATHSRIQDQGSNRLVPNTPTPVDNEVWVTQADMIRTRVTLAQLQGEQERLAAELDAGTVRGFADRADWLIAHRTPDEQLAWRRRWRALGVSFPEPSIHFERPASLAAPKRRRRMKFTPEQLRVAAEWAARQAAA